jgi:hypothetical protein
MRAFILLFLTVFLLVAARAFASPYQNLIHCELKTTKKGTQVLTCDNKDGTFMKIDKLGERDQKKEVVPANEEALEEIED